MKNITVVGVGYVGLVTGVCFADLGNRVIGLDINAERIEAVFRSELADRLRGSFVIVTDHKLRIRQLRAE